MLLLLASSWWIACFFRDIFLAGITAIPNSSAIPVLGKADVHYRSQFTRPETQPSQAHHGCSRYDRSIALDASTCCSREMSAHGPTDQLISALEESLVLSRTQGKDLPSIQQLSSSIHLNQQCPQNHPNNHPHKARRRITNPSSPRPPRVQNS